MLTLSQRNQIEYLLEDIVSVTTGAKKGSRFSVADVYETCLSAGGYFPRKPLSMRRSDALILRKKICSYCPSAIRPATMKKYVEEAKQKLLEYGHTLKTFLSENPEQEETISEPTDVHDLGSTI